MTLSFTKFDLKYHSTRDESKNEFRQAKSPRYIEINDGCRILSSKEILHASPWHGS
jgi:hypothetical protein